jgi:hypothetical protein
VGSSVSQNAPLSTHKRDDCCRHFWLLEVPLKMVSEVPVESRPGLDPFDITLVVLSRKGRASGAS